MDCMEQDEHFGCQKSRRLLVEATPTIDPTNSMTDCHFTLGENPEVGGSQTNGTTWVPVRGLELFEKEGGTAWGAKRRGRKNI